MLTWFQTVAELCWGGQGWMEAVEPPVEWYSPGARGRLRAELGILRSIICIRVERLGWRMQLTRRDYCSVRGKMSFENSRLGDAFIVCMESSQTRTKMRKAYSFSA